VDDVLNTLGELPAGMEPRVHLTVDDVTKLKEAVHDRRTSKQEAIMELGDLVAVVGRQRGKGTAAAKVLLAKELLGPCGSNGTASARLIARMLLRGRNGITQPSTPTKPQSGAAGPSRQATLAPATPGLSLRLPPVQRKW
jgi:hypothetical protein